jgi:hypothetical protein
MPLNIESSGNVAIIALSLAATIPATAGTVICQPLGNAMTCTDGSTAMPLGSGAYIARFPRDTWGQRVHPEHDRPNEWRNEK